MTQRFNNGNIHIKFNKEDITDIKAGKFSDIEVLSWELENVDTYFIGEQFCLSNYAMGVMLYSYYADKVFILNFADLEKLLDGKTLILYAATPSADDREIIENY